jgi:hypothetical protein
VQKHCNFSKAEETGNSIEKNGVRHTFPWFVVFKQIRQALDLWLQPTYLELML